MFYVVPFTLNQGGEGIYLYLYLFRLYFINWRDKNIYIFCLFQGEKKKSGFVCYSSST